MAKTVGGFPLIGAAAVLLLAANFPGCASTSSKTPPAPAATDDFLIRSLVSVDAADAAILLHELLGVAAYSEKKTNTIFVKGKTEDLKLAAGLLDSLNVSDDRQSTTFIYQLKNAHAAELAVILQLIFGGDAFRDNKNDPPVKIVFVPDIRTNAIVIAGIPENYVGGIVKIIDELDRPLTPPTTLPATQPATPPTTK